jgi:hypothetical protein
VSEEKRCQCGHTRASHKAGAKCWASDCVCEEYRDTPPVSAGAITAEDYEKAYRTVLRNATQALVRAQKAEAEVTALTAERDRLALAPDWRPTPDNINALPDPLRRYIHALETDCDPAGTIRSEVILREHTVPELQARVVELEAERNEAQVWDRAHAEALSALRLQRDAAEAKAAALVEASTELADQFETLARESYCTVNGQENWPADWQREDVTSYDAWLKLKSALAAQAGG